MLQIIIDIFKNPTPAISGFTEPVNIISLLGIFATLIVAIYNIIVNRNLQKQLQKMKEQEALSYKIFEKRLELYEKMITWSHAAIEKSPLVTEVEARKTIPERETLEIVVTDMLNKNLDFQGYCVLYATEEIHNTTKVLSSKLLSLHQKISITPPNEYGLLFQETISIITDNYWRLIDIMYQEFKSSAAPDFLKILKTNTQKPQNK